MTESLPDHGCRPRCCDFCLARGLKADPLTRVYVRVESAMHPTYTNDAGQLAGGIVFPFWVHRDCMIHLVQGPGARTVWEVTDAAR